MPKDNLLDKIWSLFFLELGHMTELHDIAAAVVEICQLFVFLKLKYFSGC